MFEANAYAGGHTNTVRVDTPNETHWVDTGFIVFNDRNYPRFERLLDRLGVRGQPSNMSFAVTDERATSSTRARRPTACSPSARTSRRRGSTAWWPTWCASSARRGRCWRADGDGPSLGQFLEERRYSRAFVDRLIVPQAAAVWSADPRQMWSFPARFLIEFFANHGMLGFRDRPKWRTVAGGSHRYVEALAAPWRDRLRLVDAGRGRSRRHDDHVDGHAARRAKPSASTTSSSPPTPTRR